MTTAKEQIGDTSEMSGQAQAAPAVEDLDPVSLAAIRDLLATETTEQAAPQLDPAVPVAQQAAVQPTTAREPTKRELLEQHSIAPPKPQARTEAPGEQSGGGKRAKAKWRPGTESGPVAQMKAAALGYRPTPRHIVIGCALLVVVFRPWLVLGITFLSLFIFTGIFLILGYDGFWRRAMGLARWYARRHPSRAVEMHRKLDSFALKWDAILDRFPEGTVDGLYLPDFGDLAEAESRHDAALDRRFAEMRNTEA